MLLSLLLLGIGSGFSADPAIAPGGNAGSPTMYPQGGPGVSQSTRGPQEHPSRALSRALTSAPRLAGTPGSEAGTELVARTLEKAGFGVTLDRREVLLSYPRSLRIVGMEGGESGSILFETVNRFDPDAWPAEDIPLFHGWTASGQVEGPVVDTGRGLRADFEALVAEGVQLQGSIALARYGGAYRGVKAEMAQAFGCAGLLLFNDPSVDGPDRGETWPLGPWKPGWDAERGAILSIARVPGDPTTPGWASPAPGVEGRRLSLAETEARLPLIPSLPIGSTNARLLLETPEARVTMEVDAPRVLRTITNVVGRLPGTGTGLVIAGNHRDSWVRGAQDAGSGTVSLLRCAQRLGQAFEQGWRPDSTIVLGFWDAEEYGLIGSTEWAEANSADLRSNAKVYINADAVVSGLRLSVSGTPGLEALAERAMAKVPDSETPGGTLREQFLTNRVSVLDTPEGEAAWSLGLAGSGSDYTVFLHHLGIPVLDLSFGGNRAGQYHTSFDDFETMDRWLDPTWEGHETAGLFLAQLLRIATETEDVFDDARAAQAMASQVRSAGQQAVLDVPWLGVKRAEQLALALDGLAATISASERTGTAPRRLAFHPALQREAGLPQRPWYRNVLWAPGLETGYAAVTLPTLRLAALDGQAALEAELRVMTASVEALASAWRRDTESGQGK
ncbi:MAG: N-acetylated-alpha-linked acidic dipeptidase [Planctomycetota bacterium]|jgi:N-acetylated-alpha-linked acidic dipeptidase